MHPQTTLVIQQAISAWSAQIKRTEQLFSALSDEQLMQEVSPGRNRGIYLLGHLAAVHDLMLPLLGFGARHYAQLDEQFLSNPDDASKPMPALDVLREYWTASNARLADHINQLPAEAWLDRHTAVSPEDFEKEPHRNRLNVLLSRTNHVSSHHGQLLFLKK